MRILFASLYVAVLTGCASAQDHPPASREKPYGQSFGFGFFAAFFYGLFRLIGWVVAGFKGE